MTYTDSNSSWLMTNTAGDQLAFWRYDAFGNLAFGTSGSPFGYAGQYQDTSSNSTGSDNMRARWYDPQTGSFTARDADFGETDQAYSYAGGDPINRADPSGLSWYGEQCTKASLGHDVASFCILVNQSDIQPWKIQAILRVEDDSGSYFINRIGTLKLTLDCSTILCKSSPIESIAWKKRSKKLRGAFDGSISTDWYNIGDSVGIYWAEAYWPTARFEDHKIVFVPGTIRSKNSPISVIIGV
jgi:RHS repeat-associated protein